MLTTTVLNIVEKSVRKTHTHTVLLRKIWSLDKNSVIMLWKFGPVVDNWSVGSGKGFSTQFLLMLFEKELYSLIYQVTRKAGLLAGRWLETRSEFNGEESITNSKGWCHSISWSFRAVYQYLTWRYSTPTQLLPCITPSTCITNLLTLQLKAVALPSNGNWTSFVKEALLVVPVLDFYMYISLIAPLTSDTFPCFLS